MLLRKKKIPCYVLIFDQVDIIKSSINFLTHYTDKLDLIIIENPSVHSPQIKRLIDGLGKQGLVKRHYLFDTNITNNAYDIILTKELASIRKSRFIMFTDGDLTCKDSGWLEEETKILSRNEEVFACGVSLEVSNLPLTSFPDAKKWIPADKNEYGDYFEARTGGHLLLLRGSEFYNFMQWKTKNNLHFVDGDMHRYCYEIIHKQWARTKIAKAYHLTWDLYKDKTNPYTRLKTGKSFEETWHHQGKAQFTLTSY